MYYKFHLGRVVTSPNVRATLTPDQLESALRQHAGGDWIGAQRVANEEAVIDGRRIFSPFTVECGGRQLALWIMTEADRTETFVMFPSESAYRASDLEEDPEPHLYRPLK